MAPDDPQNPFAPPKAVDSFAEPWPPKTGLPPGGPATSSVPKVFGTLSIIFASIVMLGGLLGSCGLCLAFAPENTGAPEARAMVQPMKLLGVGMGLQSLMLLGMSVWLLILGIGQLRYRRWARGQSVAWGGAGLVGVAVMVVLGFLVIGPAYREMFDAAAHLPDAMHGGSPPPNFPASFGTLMGGSMSLMSVIFYAPYPILMLIMFSRENVKASMSA
jgi:hypothetical protein